MAAKKANMVLGQLSRGVSFRDRTTFIGLYKTYVRPHLEYCVQAWAPWTAGDKEVLESVQRRAVGMVSNLRGSTYEEKLAELGMVTLEKRRLRGDLIQAYKIISGKDNVDVNTWFRLVQPNDNGPMTRAASGHLNILRNEGRTEVRRNFWSVRVCDAWNNLPDLIKGQPSTNGFKNSLDNFMAGQSTERHPLR